MSKEFPSYTETVEANRKLMSWRPEDEKPVQKQSRTEQQIGEIRAAKNECFQDIISHKHINESGMIAFEHRIYQRFYEKVAEILK